MNGIYKKEEGIIRNEVGFGKEPDQKAFLDAVDKMKKELEDFLKTFQIDKPVKGILIYRYKARELKDNGVTEKYYVKMECNLDV
jgi:hypothetical protein